MRVIITLFFFLLCLLAKKKKKAVGHQNFCGVEECRSFFGFPKFGSWASNLILGSKEIVAFSHPFFLFFLSKKKTKKIHNGVLQRDLLVEIYFCLFIFLRGGRV